MTLSTLEVESECQTLVEVFARFVTQVQTRRAAAAADGKPVDYGWIEQEFALGAAALEREAHAIVLRALDIDEPQVQVDGQRYRRVLRSTGKYYTMVGAVRVPRTLYRKVGERLGATVDAVSLRAGVVAKGWLPRTAAAMAWECQRAPSREAQKASEQWLRLPYSRSAFQSMSHRVAEQYRHQREAVERELIQTLKIPEQAHSVSVSMDRVSIAMEEPRSTQMSAAQSAATDSVDNAAVQQVAAELAPSEVKKRPKRPIQRVFRQAYAATVTLHDAKGKALQTIRYGRMPMGDIDGLCTALADDVMTLLRSCPTLLVVLLCDGAKELWNRLGAEFTESGLGKPVYRLVDLWHLLEKLGSAARVLYEEQDRDPMLRKWRLDLLNHDAAVPQILATLQNSGKEQVRVGDSRPVHEAITYLQNHLQDMRYAQARRLGLPVGSGIVEASCKSLFQVRLKRPGCRWKQETGAHIVELRALALSNRFDQGLACALAPLRREVKPALALSDVLSCAA